MSASLAEAPPEAPPIFVVGTGRSGSTLLRLMLSAHPRIYVSHESSVYAWNAVIPRCVSGGDFLESYFRTFLFRWLRIAPDAVRALLPSPFTRDDVGALFAAVMRVHAGRHGAARYGDKTPIHAHHLRRLYADFPDARVVHITRDPRGTAQSLSRMPWASASDFANCFGIEATRKKIAPFADRILLVRLEDLLEAPRDTMARVLDFVGEPWDDAVLDHPSHIRLPDDMPAVPWLASATRPLGKPRASWRAMDPVRIRTIESWCRGSMKAYGYEPLPLDPDPSWWRVAWAGWRSVPEGLRFLLAYLRLGIHTRKAAGRHDARADALFRRLNPPAWAHYPDDFALPEPPPLPGTEQR